MKQYVLTPSQMWVSHCVAALCGAVGALLAAIIYASYTNVVPETATFSIIGNTIDDAKYVATLTYEKREDERTETERQSCIGLILQEDLKQTTTTSLLHDSSYPKTVNASLTPFRAAVERAEAECGTNITSSSFSLRMELGPLDQGA